MGVWGYWEPESTPPGKQELMEGLTPGEAACHTREGEPSGRQGTQRRIRRVAERFHGHKIVQINSKE